ncbi:MAG: YdcF family protein [Chloroflexi bacterium]|nr:YdcF family protein [Chloroflexota bacterium]
MFIFLSKLLPLFVYPLGLTVILLVAAILTGSNRKTSRVLIIAAVALLWLSSTSGVSNLLARSLEWRYLPPDEIPAADVIVLLGGGTESAAYPRSTVEINSAGDRVLYAAQVFFEGKSPVILLSGGEIAWLNNGTSTPAQDMASLLIQMGVPESALILENESQNTYENALKAREILSEMEIDNILLVTSAMHMPRSVALFEKQGFEVTPLPVDYSVTEGESKGNLNESWINRVMDIIPSASSLALTTNALKEYLGMLIYTLQGWM